MLARLILSLIVVFLAVSAFADHPEKRQDAVVMDADLWVTFYDLPSRRFRAIRTAILNQNTKTASRDLLVTANFLSVEAERASAAFQPPLREVVERMRRFSGNIDDVTLEDLDSVFGRTHWLLAQHYLEFARRARDLRQNENASLYLWATTHHIERAILWSNTPVTREARTTLDNLRDAAGRLQDSGTSARAYRDKPIVRAEKLLRKIAIQIDRPVLLPAMPDKADKPAGDATESKMFD